MKKALTNIFGQAKDESAKPAEAPQEQQLHAVPPPKPNEFLGRRSGYAIAIYFPEYGELAAFLSRESREKFISEYRNAIDNAVGKLISLVDLSDSGLALIALDESPKQNPNLMIETVNELYRELRLWVGTFGRSGIPPLKYGIGVSRGEIVIDTAEPKVSGLAVSDALQIAKHFCVEFDVRLGVSGELVRATTEAAQWLDYDDCVFERADGEAGVSKPVRIYSKHVDRLDPVDIQMVRAARKAYFLQNWDEAHAKFDRLTLVPTFRHLANLYLTRIERLRTKAKNPQWDGVFRG